MRKNDTVLCRIHFGSITCKGLPTSDTAPVFSAPAGLHTVRIAGSMWGQATEARGEQSISGNPAYRKGLSDAQAEIQHKV